MADLFRKDTEGYTEASRAFVRELDEAVKAVVNRWANKFPLRGLELLAHHVVSDVFSVMILDKMVRKHIQEEDEKGKRED